MSTFVPIEELVRFAQGAAIEEARPVLDRVKRLRPGSDERARMAVPTLAEGEQYRFHFDMTRCIGCRSCEVACNEQNNNPPEVNWRRVGEVEGGVYPDTVRLHISMACNHCLEPSCLEGCPVDAYTKLANGVVDHDADACIGCQYCTWSCPYGVPQFHAERRVVTKCNLCVDRLGDGQLPACVNACPTTAIEVEAVDVEGWRSQIAAANAPGVPPADLTLSTTRITVPADLPESIGSVETQRLQPEAPHWSLVWFLTLSQWSVGLFAAAVLFAGDVIASAVMASIAWSLAALSLASATCHLGRPIHAWRAVRAWRHSWLSREVIAFGIYSLVGALPALVAFGGLSARAESGWLASSTSSTTFAIASGLAALAGVAGIVSSVGIYRIPARPAWDSGRTPTQFFATMFLLGATTTLVVTSSGLAGALGALDDVARWMLAGVASVAAIVSALAPWQLVLAGLDTDESGVRGASILLTRRFGRLFWSRTVALSVVAAFAPVTVLVDGASIATICAAGAALLAFAAEIAGRYLFFVAVVPRNTPGGFFTTRAGGH